MSHESRDVDRGSLIEDVHQGVTTAHAQATIDRYTQFVRDQNAPIANMNYSPFTKRRTNQRTQRHQPQQPPLPSKSEFVLQDEVVPASHTQSASSSRAQSPTRQQKLEPSVLHTRVGGAAWSIEMPSTTTTTGHAGWVKTSDSKRGSRVGSTNASRKSSLTFAEPKNLALRVGGPSGHETSQSIWAATTSEERVGAPLHSHRSLEKEQQVAADERLAEPAKRLSLSHTKPFLRAHAAEAKLGVTQNSRFVGKQKRASMPPLQNRRPSSHFASHSNHGASTSSSSTSRRSSLVTHVTPAQPLRAAAMRNRSQSLPCDSLFLAYSSCALPAVMTSSLANMPIPSQPAIPVAVARRYSILSASDLPHHQSAASMQEAQQQAKDEELVNIDPENVEGIDTSSTLDTSHLQDMAPLDDDEDDENGSSDEGSAERDKNSRFSGDEADEEEFARALNPSHSSTATTGGSASSSKSHSVSKFSTPMGSPIGEGEEVSVDSFPLSLDSVHVPQHLQQEASIITPPSASINQAPQLNNPNAASASGLRTRSMINTAFRNGLNITAPTRDQVSTPDYTPMTSPTNLSNIVFKQTLITRRMSDVVARDIARKLKLLKQHMQHEGEEEKTSPA